MSNRKKLPRSRSAANSAEWLDAILSDPRTTENERALASAMVAVARNGKVHPADLEDYFGLERGDLDGVL